jgi:hypothetical protein
MKRFSLVLALWALCFLVVYSQQNTGDIYGKVLLSDGSALPGVAVTLSGEKAGKMQMTTSTEGNYRFLRLSPGLYNLTFELEGFKSLLRKNVTVNASGTVTINVIMETGALTETVEVVGRTTMIDTRKATLGAHISSNLMEQLPTGNSIASFVNLTPGISTANTPVGGIGGTTRIIGSGTIPNQNQFTIDGASADNTDYYERSLGASVSTFYLEETQVSIGAHDITNRQGGVQVNFVSKRGGNKISGDSYVYLMDKKFEMDQTLPKEMLAKGWIPQGVERKWDYGMNLGFPIIKEHLWFFGSAAMADLTSRSLTNVTSRPSYNPNYFGKINAQLGNLKAEVSYNWNTSQSIGTFYSVHANTTRDSNSPTSVFVGRADYILGNLLVSGKYSYVKSRSQGNGHGFTLTGTGKTYADGATFAYPGMACAQNFAYSDAYYSTPNATQSYADATGIRPYAIFEGDYFREKLLGGDHEFKVGFDVENAEYIRVNMPMGQFLNAFNYKDSSYPGGTLNYISILRDGVHDLLTDRTGFFFQDTANYKKLTVVFGLRYDMNQWKWKSVTIHEHNALNLDGTSWLHTNAPAWIPYLGSITFPAGSVPSINRWSPRLSFAYDLTGDGKNVIKMSLASYGGAVGNAELNAANISKGSGFPVFTTPFVDKNNNYWPDIGEFTAYTPDQIDQIRKDKTLPGWSYYTYSGMNQAGPLEGKAPTTIIDPNFKPRSINEVILGFEKQIGNDVVVSATGSYKKNFNEQWLRSYFGTKDNYRLITKDDFLLSGTDPVTGRNVYIQNPALGQPAGAFFTNYKNSFRTYYGLDLQFSKKLSHHWMMNASLDYNDFKYHWTSDEYFGSGQGMLDYYDKAPDPIIIGDSKWQFKINGLLQLPWDFSVSGIFTARQGFPITAFVNRFQGVNLAASGVKYGDTRLANVSILDLLIEKIFLVSETTQIILFVNGYNILNNTTVLSVNANAIPQDFQAQSVISPGIFQIGARIKW